MSFLNYNQINEIRENIVSDEIELKRNYRVKKNKNQIQSVKNSLVDDYIDMGWEIEKEFTTKTRMKKKKSYLEEFKDDVWCQFYELGYRNLNCCDTFALPFNKCEEKKYIDIIAINEETVFLVECKSSEKPQKAPSYKTELDSLRLKIEGIRKVIFQLFGKDIKIKYIFATRNLRLNIDGEDIKNIEQSHAFYYNDNTYSYINNLIKHYKSASIYQFLGLIFKNELINNNKIEIPVVQGWMGKKKYYMFSIEPDLLLKIGFILHRTKANDVEFPTYQRLLVPSRLKGISKFIDGGGYFPNSIIINFNSDKKNKILFEPASSKGSSKSNIGILKIPNAYAIAYIIDGQHRLYGYANSKYLNTNTIPVVALEGLDSDKQLSIFMDINQNQKAVSPSLKLDLEEYIHWDSERADSRLKALRSSIIKYLSNEQGSLYNKISIGEDVSLLSSAPFEKALVKSGLLPSAKNNQYDKSTIIGSLYNINNNKHTDEMEKARYKIVQLINNCYELVEEGFFDIFNREKYFILSNRGTFAFITLIGNINVFLTNCEELTYSTNNDVRFAKIKKYLIALLTGINNLSEEKEKEQLSLLGAGADIKWLRLFQSIINESFPQYDPPELVDWKERQDDELQNTGRTYGIEIEKHMKKFILSNLEKIYSDKWDLEIGKIKRDCVSRALEEDEKNHKEGLNKESSDWKEMFNINDYKTIIEKHWSKKPENDNTFVSFEEKFSIDVGKGFNSKSEKVKWISIFNSYRNLWAHEGSKEKRLNREEVQFLEKIYNNFIS